MIEDAHDICLCGDYRRQHQGRTGKCLFRDHGIPSWPDPELNSCTSFRLLKAAHPCAECEGLP